jgi:release factor glutamine methyltransferase
MPTISEAILNGRKTLIQAGVDSPRLDSELLMAFVLDCDRVALYAHSERQLATDESARYAAVVAERSARRPLQYIIGSCEFFSERFHVAPDVLIPRPETEVLVEHAIALLHGRTAPRVVDIGTGSGIIAICIAKHVPSAEIVATDISAAALGVARQNAALHRVEGRMMFLEGDLFEPLRLRGLGPGFDIIASNPPYVSAEDLPMLQPEVRLYEPHEALVSGGGTLDVIRRVVAESPQWLDMGGHLLMEIGLGQMDAVSGLLSAEGKYEGVHFLNDLSRIPRVAVAKLARAR